MAIDFPGRLSSNRPRPVEGAVDATLYESEARLVMPVAIEGMLFSAHTPSGHTLTIDTLPQNGGTDSGPHPLELLLVALASCTGMDTISILRKKRQTVTHYTINVYANQAQSYPHIYTEILVEHVVGGENVDPAAVARSIELSITKYCPVHALLSRATRVEHVYRVLD